MSLYATTFCPTFVICDQVPGLPLLSGARSILKPSSVLALSTHARSIRLDAIVVATRPEGAAGGGFAAAIRLPPTVMQRRASQRSRVRQLLTMRPFLATQSLRSQ